MLENMSALALVPKAKHIGSLRLTTEDYQELMRRRSVIEVITTLQNHPYFSKSLGGLAKSDLHRSQLEEALRRDVFFKYESLMRYSFRKNHFGAYFIVQCEINELLQKLRLMSMQSARRYIMQLPGFLLSKTSFDLLKLATVETLPELCKLIAGTPYLHALQPALPKQNEPLDYLRCEQALQTYYYRYVLQKINEDLSGANARETKELFLCEAEIYNLDLLYRCKAFYASRFSPEQLEKLLIPVYYFLSAKEMRALARTPSLDTFLTTYNQSRAARRYGERTAARDDAGAAQERRRLYATAERLLHFSSSPQTVLCALLCLANLERSNVVTIVEGVRYGLSADQIERYIKRA